MLEENGLLVTKGNWQKPLQSLLEELPGHENKLSGVCSSVQPMVREIRNMVAHENADVIGDEVWTRIRALHVWLIMHCFTVRVLSATKHIPSLVKFAHRFETSNLNYPGIYVHITYNSHYCGL